MGNVKYCDTIIINNTKYLYLDTILCDVLTPNPLLGES